MRGIITIIILLILNLIGYSQGLSGLVEQGNEYYKNGEFELAIDAYMAVIDSGYESAGLYYNLGNAYYKSHKHTMALVNYERARLLDPTDEEINHNLLMARQFIVDKIDELPEFLPKVWYKRFISILGTDQWAYISMAVFITGLILFLLFLFGKTIRIRKISFWFALVFLVISFFAFIFSYHQKKLVYDQQYAIIFAPSITIKSSPDESGTELFQLHEGTKVEVIDQLGEWREIKLSDGNVGWLRSGDIIKL